MTSPQLVLYLAFALACALAQFAWLQILTIMHRRRFAAPETLLNARKRMELEERTSDCLILRCAHHALEREKFLQTCFRHVPQLSDELFAHLQRRPEIALRLITDSISHLPDRRLIQLAEQLGCLRSGKCRVIIERPIAQLWPLRWRVSQQLIVGAALIALLVILLIPPWVAERQRQIRILGVSRSLQTLERKATGYHWLLDAAIPARQTTPRVTENFPRLEFDVYGWRIDYPRLCLQLVTLTLATGALIWLRHPTEGSIGGLSQEAY